MHGRYLAEKLGVFHIDFQERLQELIISKTKKRVGPDYEDEEEEDPAQEDENSKRQVVLLPCELIRIFVYIFQAEPIGMPQFCIPHGKWQMMYLFTGSSSNIYAF